MKKIAIIISAYNATEYILECVTSVQNQLYAHGWEYDIRIGVDGCPDTARVLQENKIPYYYSQINVGSFTIKNSLIYKNSADVYTYFDADDVMFENYLLQCIEQIESGHEAIIPAKYNTDKSLKIIDDSRIEDGGSMAFTHKLLDAVGGYYQFRCACDTDFMRRLVMAGFSIRRIEDPLYYRRCHSGSLTKSGLTVYGGDYRKQSWKTMCGYRKSGIIKIRPEVVDMELFE